MDISLLGTAYPIYLIGESHCVVFGNTLFRSERSQEIFLTKAKFLHNLKSEEFMLEGKVNPRLLDALQSEDLLENGVPKHLVDTSTTSSVAYIQGKPVMAPALVLFSGDVSLHEFFQQIGNRYDFLLPEDETYGVDQAKELIPIDVIRKKIKAILANFLSSVLALKQMGFNRLMIHCLPPRTTNAIKAARFNIDCKIRAKITVLANQHLSEFCKNEGIGFIDNWQETTVKGFLREELDLDGVHLTKPSVTISLRQIIDYLLDIGSHYNHTRYQIAVRRNKETFTSPRNSGREEWKQGYIIDKADDALIECFSSNLTFNINKNNLARMDWASAAADLLQNSLMAMPTAQHLQTAEQIFQTNMKNILQGDSACSLTISCLRPIQIKATINTKKQSVPPAIRKAIVALDNKGKLSLVNNDEAIIKEIPLKKGDIIVYDPNQIHCHYVHSTEDFEVLEIIAIPQLSNHDFRVIWAGFNDWPVDPFSYSTKDFKAYPAFHKDHITERAHAHPHAIVNEAKPAAMMK